MKHDYKVSLEDIIAMLNAQWDSLVSELVPNVVMKGSGPGIIGDIDGTPGKSCVFYRGHKAGSWVDYGAGEKGDAIILIEKVTGTDRKAAILWARQWLGIDDVDEATFRQRREKATKAAKKRDTLAVADKIKRWGQAKAIFIKAQMHLFNSWGDLYYKSRGIYLAKLSGQPRALRFEEECWEGETRAKHPAIIASITVPHAGGYKMAIHRTYLRCKSNYKIDKLDVRNPKKVLGDYRGGYIPLWRGQTGKPLYRCEDWEWVLICEGVEDGLALAISDPTQRVIVAVSLGNMATIVLPPAVKGVMLVKDNDWDNPQAEAAFARAIAWHQSNGRRVKVLSVPAGKGKDINDWLSGKKEG